MASATPDQMDQGGPDVQLPKRRRRGNEGVQEHAPVGPLGGTDGGGASNTGQANADIDEGDLSGDDASLLGSDSMAQERELDERTLEDEVTDDQPGRQSEPVDDAGYVEYVDSLTLPRSEPLRARGDGAASTAGPQEPGSDVDIRESFRKFVKDDQFERAAAVADVTGLGLQQKAEREGHILKVSTRKSRSEESFEAINRAASLFIAFMKSREDLQEQNDRKDASIFYPSSYKLLKFVDWQERRASLALQEASPSQSASGSSVQWFVDPRRFGAGEGNPHLAELVRWRMDILNQKYAATIPTLGLEFVAGVAAFTTYGRNTRLKMMRSLLSRSFSSWSQARLLADTNLRHACIARGEFTRNLTFNNLALLPKELTPQLGPVPTRALLVSWRNKWYRARVFTTSTGKEYQSKVQYRAVKKLHVDHGVGGHVVHAARVSASQEDARNRVPLGETQAVTHMKDLNGGALGTTQMVYRPLSAQSALSQSGAVRPGESAGNATYYNPRQHVDVPESLVENVLPAFTEVKRELLDGPDKDKGRLTERGTLDLIDYLRYVLVRGAVELQEELPDTWVFKKFPFNSREFLDWAPRARNEIRQLRAADVKSRLHYQASPAIITELARVNGKVDRLTELLELSIAKTERLENLLANQFGAMPEPSAVPCSSFGGLPGRNAPATSTASAPSSSTESGSSSPHPVGWFHGKLPGFGTCGGKRGSLSQIWQIWGGAGPGKVTGGEAGLNLRAHGETSMKEQQEWGSTSNYGRYVQAGRYMDSLIASVKEEKGFADKEATNEMLFLVHQEKGTETVTTWFSNYVAGGGKGKKRSSAAVTSV